jgi:Uma2 family endonuclease
VAHERWPIERRAPQAAAWEVVPDLAVEIVSPTNKGYDDAIKLEEYFRAGTRLVWVVYPPTSKVYVYGSPTSVRILALGDELDGGAVLPGFRLPLATLFGPEAP